MLALIVIASFASFGVFVSRAAEGPRWNSPELVIMHLPFPSQEEVTAKAVSATPEERADGMKWITEFLKPAAMPDGIEGHLLALKDAIPKDAAVIGSGYPELPPGGIKLSSGLVVKYELQGYAFQVMETKGKVVVGVQNLSDTPAKTSEADRIAFVEDIVQRFIKPQPADPFIIAKHLPLATYVFYSPRKRIQLPSGNYAYDPDLVRQNAFRDVNFATDGKSVIFEAFKNLTLPVDPQKPRFAAESAPEH
jgi:hypothetical protein